MRHVVLVLMLVLASGYRLQNACAEELNGKAAASEKALGETRRSSSESLGRVKDLAGGESNAGWLESVFPSMNNCTPSNYYYDIYKKRSANGVIESKGYLPYKIDADLAYYKIREKFFGLDATEIFIPSGTFSSYGVIVSASAKRLSEAIRNNTGQKLTIAGPTFKLKSATAFIMSRGSNKSLFACTTYYGGDE